MQARADIYCLIAPEAPERSRRSLARALAEAGITTLDERRTADRRKGPERRQAEHPRPPDGVERRRVQNRAGRRVAERRASLVEVSPKLQGKARRLADRLAGHIGFYQRVVPSERTLERMRTDRAVIRFQSGEREGFDEIYRHYYPRVHRYARLALSDEHEAEDVAQQVFIRVLGALPTYEVRPEGEPVGAWLHTITRNATINAIQGRGELAIEPPERIERRLDTELRVQKSTRPHDDILFNDELLRQAERLPEAQRQVIVLRFALGLDFDQIADLLDRTPESVRQLASRGQRVLTPRMEAIRQRTGRRRPMRLLLRHAPVLRARRFALLRRR